MPHAALVTDDLPSFLSVGPARPTDDRLARCLCGRRRAASRMARGLQRLRASVACQTVDGPVSGRVTVAAHGHVAVDCDDPIVRTRLDDMLATCALDRTPRFFDDGDGQFPISFADAGDASPCRVDPRARPAGRPPVPHRREGAGPRDRAHRAWPARGHRVRGLHAHDSRPRAADQTVTSTWDVATGALLRVRVGARQPPPRRARVAAVRSAHRAGAATPRRSSCPSSITS